MCGIVGILNKNCTPVDETFLKAMCDLIRHRGPDDEGFFVNNCVGLGVQRLKVIDLVAGHQPIHNEDSTVWTVFNGEIYNFRSLRSDLISKGHIFSTNSDTEVIVHSYEEWGDDFVTQLDGMFALAIWDQKDHRLVVVRDRIGIKPLYFYEDAQDIVFASEIKSILLMPAIKRRVNLQALGSYLTFAYVPAPLTMFQSIKKLLPGHMLIHHDGVTEIKSYWNYKYVASGNLIEKTCLDELAWRLRECVNSMLISDVPLGVFLSGGIDSSIIVGLMSEQMDGPVKTFSIGFEEEDYNELRYARMVAKHYCTEHHELVITAAEIDALPKIVWHLDEPLGDATALPTWYLSQFARQYVTVVLSGAGGDELFGGYDRYRRQRFLEAYCQIPRTVRERFVPLFAKALSLRTTGLSRFVSRIQMLNQSAPLSIKDRYIGWVGVLSQIAPYSILTDNLTHALADVDYLTPVARYFEDGEVTNGLNKMLYVDTKTYLVDDILTLTDKMSMAHALETRVPFLHPKIVEFAATIPPGLKIRRWETKRLLRKYLSASLPRQIWGRAKQGFRSPVSHWFKKREAIRFAQQVLLSSASTKRGYFNSTGVAKLLQDHQDGKADLGQQIWLLLNFELWCCQFLDDSLRM